MGEVSSDLSLCNSCRASYHKECVDVVISWADGMPGKAKCSCCGALLSKRTASMAPLPGDTSSGGGGCSDANKKPKVQLSCGVSSGGTSAASSASASPMVALPHQPPAAVFAPRVARVAVIGTAGRGTSKEGLTAALYEKMVAAADSWIQANVKAPVNLVSGGAAWSDHIAVTLFLRQRYPHLTLHLPCPFVLKNGKHKYSDEGPNDWRQNPGRSANRYHEQFSAVLQRQTLEEIWHAVQRGAVIRVHSGFFARNTEVARSEYLIAFSWSPGDAPLEGGTADTWNKCTSRKHHFALNKLASQ